MSSDIGGDMFSDRYSVACLGRLVYLLDSPLNLIYTVLHSQFIQGGEILPMHSSEAEKIQETICSPQPDK